MEGQARRRMFPGTSLLLVLLLLLPACAPTRPSYPTPPQISKRPVIQYSLVDVSPGGGHIGKENLKIYLEAQTKPLLFGATTTDFNYRALGILTLSSPDLDLAFNFTPMNLFSPSSIEGRLVVLTPHALGFVIRNKGIHMITVDWNRAVLTDESGRALRVVHKGIKLADSGGVMSPSVIPPGSFLEDFIYPSDAIRFTLGSWTGPLFFETKPAEAELKLHLPLKMGAEDKAYILTFKAELLRE